VVNQVVIVPIGESSKRGAAFGTGVTSGTRLSIVRMVVSSNSNDVMNFVNVQSNNAKHRGLVCYTITNYLSNFICVTSGPE
jgi:hypothetical protein